GAARPAGHHLRRRARRHRALARRRPDVLGGQRRARADAQPDPHRDGRLRSAHRGHRPGGDQPPRGTRLGAAAPGAPRPPAPRTAARRRTAYHEGGHAIVGMLTPGADPVRKISIIPRGMALGVTLSAPANDKFSYDEEYLRAKIRVALGGRVAEELVLGEITTGAESDIQQLT